MSGMRKWAKRRRCYCNTTLLDMYVCVFASGRQDDVGPGLHAWYQTHDGIPRDLSSRCCAPMNCNRKSWARPRDIDIIGFSTFTRSNFSSRWWCCAGFIVLHFPFLCVSALTLLCLWVVRLPLLEWNLTNKQAQNNKQKIPKNCNICEVGDGFHCLCENPRTAEWVYTCVSLPEAARVWLCALHNSPVGTDPCAAWRAGSGIVWKIFLATRSVSLLLYNKPGGGWCGCVNLVRCWRWLDYVTRIHTESKQASTKSKWGQKSTETRGGFLLRHYEFGNETP